MFFINPFLGIERIKDYNLTKSEFFTHVKEYIEVETNRYKTQIKNKRTSIMPKLLNEFDWNNPKLKRYISFEYLENEYAEDYKKPCDHNSNDSEKAFEEVVYDEEILKAFLLKYNKYNEQPKNVKVAIGLILSLHMSLIRGSLLPEKDIDFILSVPSKIIKEFESILKDINRFFLNGENEGCNEFLPMRKKLTLKEGAADDYGTKQLCTISVLPISLFDTALVLTREAESLHLWHEFRIPRERRVQAG